MAALALVGAACTGGARPAPGPPSDAPSPDEMARRLGTDVVRSIVRGYFPEVSGQMVVVPKPWNVLGQWTGGLRGPEDPRTTHASPWSYHARVPIVLYGPGFVRSGVVSDRSVDVADLAPTFAELLGMPFDAREGQVLREALVRQSRRAQQPRAIVLVAYDGGGWNVLEQWPDAWPVERRLAAEGAVYTNATIGSAPSVTAPVHANMGTGAYPFQHGLPENTGRRPDGEISELFFHEADPRLLLEPTVADLWDRENGNRAWVGMVGFESWHLPMMGHGAQLPGADRDVALLWEREENRFWTNEEYYELPSYIPGPEVLRGHLDDLDASDGSRDGYWGGDGLDNTFFQPGTPAFVRYQWDAFRSMLENEPIGQDQVTDLAFLELKSTDYGGHIWNMVAPQQETILSAQDDVLGELVDLLDRRIGPGEYVLAVTADHGQTPVPTRHDAVRVDRYALEDDIDAYFGTAITVSAHPSELFLDLDAMEEAGITLDDVAGYVASYTYREGLPAETDLEGVPESVLDQGVFAAALPGPYLRSLTDGEIDALGPGDWPEGDLTSPQGFERLLG
jgi:predicted AlkP superfamily pyrophosphatase or phosphodiesterase